MPQTMGWLRVEPSRATGAMLSLALTFGTLGAMKEVAVDRTATIATSHDYDKPMAEFAASAVQTVERWEDKVALSDSRRAALLRSVLSSQALEGLRLSYDDANRLLDEVMREPIIHLG